MKNIIFTVAILIITTKISGQEKPLSITLKNEIGIHAGITTGLGLSYRHWFGKAGFQLTGLPIKTENTEIYSVALTALYSFYEVKYFRFYGYFGNHYFYDREEGSDQIWKNWDYGDVRDKSYYSDDSKYDHASYNIGFGPGFAFGNRLRFNLMVGYGLYDIMDSFNMYPAGEIGLYYRF